MAHAARPRHAPDGATVRLVFVDVDGTLVGSGGHVHPSVWDAADMARAVGLPVALSTGRPDFGVTSQLARRLNPESWHVFQNGASIVNPGTGRSLSSPLDRELVKGLVDRARETRRLLELYTDSDYAFECDSELARAHAELLGVPYRPRPFASLVAPVVRALWVLPASEAALVAAEDHAGMALFGSTSPVMPAASFLNLTAAGVDKASAVRTVAASYGVAMDEVMFVGDSANDIPPMRAVGIPVAMGNASAAVHAEGAWSVGNVDDGGLAEALSWAVEHSSAP